LHEVAVGDVDLGLDRPAGRERRVDGAGGVRRRDERAPDGGAAAEQVDAGVEVGVHPVAADVPDVVALPVGTEHDRLGDAYGLRGVTAPPAPTAVTRSWAAVSALPPCTVRVSPTLYPLPPTLTDARSRPGTGRKVPAYGPAPAVMSVGA